MGVEKGNGRQALTKDVTLGAMAATLCPHTAGGGRPLPRFSCDGKVRMVRISSPSDQTMCQTPTCESEKSQQQKDQWDSAVGPRPPSPPKDHMKTSGGYPLSLRSGATPSPGGLTQAGSGFLRRWSKGWSPAHSQSPWNPEGKLLFRTVSQLPLQGENSRTSFLFSNSSSNILAYCSGRNHGNPTPWQFVFLFLCASLLRGSRKWQCLLLWHFWSWEWSHDPAQASETKENLWWEIWFLNKRAPCLPNLVCIQPILTTWWTIQMETTEKLEDEGKEWRTWLSSRTTLTYKNKLAFSQPACFTGILVFSAKHSNLHYWRTWKGRHWFYTHTLPYA